MLHALEPIIRENLNMCMSLFWKVLNINLVILAVYVSINFGRTYLQEIADVDDECAGNRLYVDPLFLVEDLEPTNTVLEEHGHEAGVGVSACADSELWLGESFPIPFAYIYSLFYHGDMIQFKCGVGR